MSEWKKCKLGEVAEEHKKAIISGPFGSNISSKYFIESGIPVIRGNNLSLDVGQKFIDEGFVFISEKKADELGTWAEKDDLIFTAAGTIGQVGLLQGKERFNRYIISNKQLRVTLNKDLIEPLFAYYWFSSPKMTETIINSDTGSTIPLINLSVLKALPILLPSLPEQKAIAFVLGSLDDKIDLLHRQNKNLEAMAETLFRQWFVEETEEDWENTTLANMVECANTGLDAIRRAPIVEQDTGIKCLRIQDISQQKNFSKWGNARVTYKDFEKARLKVGDIIMARTCSPGIIYFTREDLNAVFNNGLARIRPNKEKTYSIFLYYLFKTDDFLEHIYGISDGTSVQLNMKIGDLLSFKVKFPPKHIQAGYYPMFKKIDDKILYNKSQIHTLENLRHTLLPKIMGGEVQVEYEIK
ncbi:restriction endonuclease subunit S [Phosphitispora fastidiosa]|uniref:restriction endonuclease subunit S n=1 Tax=Phosphitispora fastidiosa TaxID=2837202 RepID=UPI001E59D7A1|nr:restriction endonuclease subunit S [Phosphitispora fastidiosa]MBU7008383.1 type I restriction enzyme S subunit [Phosphitispora fastidiosa]